MVEAIRDQWVILSARRPRGLPLTEATLPEIPDEKKEPAGMPMK
jgi:hypothetical protein